MEVDHDIFHFGIIDGALRLPTPGFLGRRVAVVDTDEINRVKVEVETSRVPDSPAKDEMKFAHKRPLAQSPALVSPGCARPRARHSPKRGQRHPKCRARFGSPLRLSHD